MGGGSGGGTSTTSTQQTIAPELQPFFAATGERAEAFQGASPLVPFTAARPFGVAPLSDAERAGITATGNLGERPAGEVEALRRIGGIPSLASERVATGRRVDTGDLTSLGGRTVDTTALGELARRRIDIDPVSGLAGRRVGGAGIENAPAIQAARLAFRTGAQPNLASQMALRGLGRSTAVAPALARAEAEFLYPAIQDELGREERRLERELGIAATGLGLEERGLERELGAATTGLGFEERGIGRALGAEQARLGLEERGLVRDIGLEERGLERELGANLQMIPLQLAAGGAETSRELAAIDAQLRAGGVERGVAQAREGAQAQDFLRRQALSEQALFGPLGSVLPSAIGQTSQTKSSGGGK